MSKKKNTLNDLNEFLKQKPNTLVDVKKLDDSPVENKEPKGEEFVISIINQIMHLANERKQDVRLVLFELIRETIENQPEVNASDLMLLNTVHYLEHTEKLNVKLKDLSD